ncbi:hypothetical protein [Flavimarina sp. Hel_I_48]|uniref:hypothetical protein n=1 Tax=Flavimarina sp. Hel_I_48 TaxID=1392488 RepID=UPI00069240EC|nr:hypothetical protein [Flavimarina sp. Hel_I_48]
MTNNQRTTPDIKIIDFDKEEFPFHKIIADYIDTTALDSLSSANMTPEGTNSYYKNMEQHPIFKKMYQKLGGDEGQWFYKLYQRFIVEVIRPHYNEAIYYQRKPSHRILFKDIKGEARFHKDSDYGHSSDEVNYWLPQTEAFETNSIWIEQHLEKGDYEPVSLKVGQCLQFNGANFRHGAFRNSTGKTRVSFDFRIIPATKMKTEALNDANEAGDNPVMSNAHKFVLCE